MVCCTCRFSAALDVIRVALPIFKTERLLLRAATLSDLDELRSLWDKSEVRRFLFDDKPVHREQAAEILEACAVLVPHGLGIWVAERHTHDEMIGCVALLPTTVAAGCDPGLKGLIEPLASFVPDAWGQGYAREALRAVISYAFTTLRMPMLAGVNDVPNEASDRMLRKLGFAVQRECEGPRYRLRTYALDPLAFHAACRQDSPFENDANPSIERTTTGRPVSAAHVNVMRSNLEPGGEDHG